MSKLERWTRRMAAVRREIGVRVVAGARAVRRPHLAQLRAALLDDVGNAERAADLDELAARDHHFLPAGRGRQEEHRGRSVVVRQDGRLAAEERAAERGEVLVARAASAVIEIEFEIRVAGDELGRLGPDRRRRSASARGSCG